VIIIPIGHESDTVRRLPWITFIIIASCLIVHLFISSEVRETSKELEGTARELVEYYINHPYLELDPEVKKLIFGERYAEEIEQSLDILGRGAPRDIPLFQEEEQEKLDQLSQRLKKDLDDISYRKWGFIPAKKSFIGLLTYMFIHSGWLHLLGNLFLLYLTGPFIEDVWGRTVYTAFYLIMGILSALMFAQHYPHFSGPLIGASGAIAGVMGAFLIRYWKTKIEFFYLIFIFARGTFKAPAWLMLPLWLLLEIFNARVMNSINPGGGGGVAHWAHIWGFIFGAVAAVGMKAFKIEEKYIHPKIEAQISYVDEGYKALEEAMLKKREGKLNEAYALLLGAARENPKHQDVVEGLWDLGVEVGKENETAKFFTPLIERNIRLNQMDIALNYFRNLKEIIPQASISLTCKIMLMQYLTEHKELKEAKELADELLQEVGLNTSPGLLLNFASTALELSPSIAGKVIELCLQHLEIPEDQKDKLKAEFDELQKKSQTATAVSDKEDITPKTEREITGEASESERSVYTKQSIQVTKAVPLGLGIKEGKIALNVEETGLKLLPLSKINSIAVAEISSSQGQSFLLIDLFLDDPKTNTPIIHAFRLFSTEFNPKKFFPKIQSSQEALKSFISDLLRLSEAAPYPDQESVLLNPPKSFCSIEEYEKAILS